MKVWLAAVVALVCLVPRPAAAADDKTASSKRDDASNPPIVFVSVTTEHVAEAEHGPRPAMLKGLYAASIGLQAFDGYSTFVGLRAGNGELNPAMQGRQTPTTLFVAKATMTLTTIALADQLWRQHHRGQAIALMVISNGVMAAVSAKNTSVLR
jgi:hypothetical protein